MATAVYYTQGIEHIIGVQEDDYNPINCFITREELKDIPLITLGKKLNHKQLVKRVCI